MYNGNKITYDNLNESTKQKFSNLENQIAKKADTNDVKIVSDNLNTLQSEVTEQLTVMNPRIDNSWQRNKENNVTISNMGKFTAEKVLLVNQSDWKNTGNVEQLDIVIPVGSGFSGLIRATYTSYWGGSESNGGATVLYRIANYVGQGEKLNDYLLETITPAFAKDFYIHKPYINPENGTIALMLNRSPAANNPFIIKLEFQGYTFSNKSAFQVLNEAHITVWDKGDPTANGYPWTPQTSRIPTGADLDKWNSTNSSLFSRFADACVDVSDWNTLTKNGMYMGGENTPNAPTTTWHMGFNIVHNELWIVQKVISFAGNGDNREYERRKIDGTWGAWIEISPMLLFQSVSNGKSQVANAITQKGVPTSATAEFATMAANIGKVSTGKKFAEGDAYSVTNRPGYVGSFIRLTGLDFQPRTVLCKRRNYDWWSVYAEIGVVGNDLKFYKGMYNTVYSAGGSAWDGSSFWLQTDDNGSVLYEYQAYE